MHTDPIMVFNAFNAVGTLVIAVVSMVALARSKEK